MSETETAQSDAPERDERENTNSQASDEPLDAVIIVAKRDARGFPAPEVILNGQVQVESVQTLLELGLKAWRKQLDLA